MSEKVFWQSSTKDPDNIDLDEILKGDSKDKPMRSPGVRNEESKMGNRSNSARKLKISRDRSGSAKRIIIGGGSSRPPMMKSPMKKGIEANSKLFYFISLINVYINRWHEQIRDDVDYRKSKTRT